MRTLFIKWYKKSVYFPRWPQYFTHILVKTWHWLSFLKSVQACDLSITDAISELLGVGHKKPLSLCLVSWGHSCLNPVPCCEEPRPGGSHMQVFWPTAPAERPDMLRWHEPQDWPTPCPDIRKSPKPTQPPEPGDNNCFRWLSFGVICFCTIDNWDSNKEKNKNYITESLIHFRLHKMEKTYRYEYNSTFQRTKVTPGLPCVWSLRLSDFLTLWTVVYQATVSLRCSRQGYWSSLPFYSSRG